MDICLRVTGILLRRTSTFDIQVDSGRRAPVKRVIEVRVRTPSSVEDWTSTAAVPHAHGWSRSSDASSRYAYEHGVPLKTEDRTSAAAARHCRSQSSDASSRYAYIFARTRHRMTAATILREILSRSTHTLGPNNASASGRRVTESTTHLRW